MFVIYGENLDSGKLDFYGQVSSKHEVSAFILSKIELFYIDMETQKDMGKATYSQNEDCWIFHIEDTPYLKVFHKEIDRIRI